MTPPHKIMYASRYLTLAVKYVALVTERTPMVSVVAFRIRRKGQYGMPRISREDHPVRTRIAVVAAVSLLALAGCNDKTVHDVAETLPPVPVVTQPAASAGGACILWDYAFIKQNLGVLFNIAASSQVDSTSTCVVQTTEADYPDLMLSVVESTKADASVFGDLKPKKATTLKGLGKSAYRLSEASTSDHGPSVEIAWLSEASQLQTLKFTFAKNPSTADVTAMNNNLLALAKAMDTTT